GHSQPGSHRTLSMKDGVHRVQSTRAHQERTISAYFPAPGANRRLESFSFSRQNSSIICVSIMIFMFISIVNGFVYALGSSMVITRLSVPKSGRVIRSVIVAAPVIGLPAVSSHSLSRKPFVVITNASPSHFPIEYPL